MKTFLKRILLMLCLAISIPYTAKCDDPDPDTVPIDGGLTLLVAAGAAYGAKKILQHKKNKDATNSDRN